MVDDAVLLRRYAETRAEEAFVELVRRHLSGVYSSALRRVGGDAHLAEDVAQQVFVALARKASALARHPFLTSWLYVTTRNEAANVVRRERRRKAREQEAQAMHELLKDEPAEADWGRVGPVLDEVMDELSEKDRAVVLLRFVDRRAFAEIGAAFRLSEDAARMRVERALDKLRVRLARRGITSTTAALGVVLANHAVLAAPVGLANTLSGSAIAAAGASGAGVFFAPFVLMTTTHKTAAVAAVVALIAAGGAWHQQHAASQAREERLALEAQLSALQARLQVSSESLGASREEPARIEYPGTGSAPTAVPTTQTLIAELEAEQMRLFLAMGWAKLAGDALPLIEKLGVSAEQLARCAELADRELDGTYFAGPNAIGRHSSAVQRRWGDETREIIGAEQFERLKELQVAQAAVERFAGYLDHWDSPLSDRQGNLMLELVAANRAAFQGDGGALPDAVLSQVRQILSPAQTESLTRFFALAETQRQLIKQLRTREAAVTAKLD